MDMRIVAHRAGEHPRREHAGQVRCPAELVVDGRAAVRDSVSLEEPRCVFDLVRRVHQDRHRHGQVFPHSNQENARTRFGTFVVSYEYSRTRGSRALRTAHG